MALLIPTGCRGRLRLDDDPAATLEFGGKVLGGYPPQCLFSRFGTGHGNRSGRRTSIMRGIEARLELGFLLEPLDEGYCLITRELSAGLALGEAHRPAGISKIAVTREVQQLQELLYLSRRGRRAC